MPAATSYRRHERDCLPLVWGYGACEEVLVQLQKHDYAALAGNGVVSAAIQDPFLQRLVRKDITTAKKVLMTSCHCSCPR